MGLCGGNGLRRRAFKNNTILVNNPHLQSRAALILLHRKIMEKAEQRYKRIRRIFLDNVEHRCAICGQTLSEQELTVDHIQKIADGGKIFHPSNWQVLCRQCHKIKDG